MEAISPSGDETDAGVDRLDDRESIREAVVNRCGESADVADDAVGDGDERLQPAPEGPAEPWLEDFERIDDGERKASRRCSFKR